MKLNVAAVQLSSGSDIARNVEAAIALVNEAADRGAQYVQVPEYFNFLGPSRVLPTPPNRCRATRPVGWPRSPRRAR